MKSKSVYNFKKPQLGRKIWSEGYLLLPLYINWSITNNLPIKTLLERIYSSIKSPGEVEYDDQNCLKHQFFLLWTDLCTVVIVGNSHFKFFGQAGVFWCCGQFYLSYSNSQRFFMLESVLSEIVLIGNFFVMDRFMYNDNGTGCE
jgi:hypothetical protein